MSDIALSKGKMLFATQDGEGFSGQWLDQYKKGTDKKGKSWIYLLYTFDQVQIWQNCPGPGFLYDLLLPEICGNSDSGGIKERIRLEKLPYVHRAVSITMDSRGRNFGVLQSDPKTRYMHHDKMK